MVSRVHIFSAIEAERLRQDELWGEQNHPILASTMESERKTLKEILVQFRKINEQAAEVGNLSWYPIIMEEVFEALTETDEEAQIEELIQAAAVLVAMIECLYRKRSRETEGTHE